MQNGDEHGSSAAEQIGPISLKRSLVLHDPTVCFRPFAEVRILDLIARNQPFRYTLEGRQCGVDFVKLSTWEWT